MGGSLLDILAFIFPILVNIDKPKKRFAWVGILVLLIIGFLCLMAAFASDSSSEVYGLIAISSFFFAFALFVLVIMWEIRGIIDRWRLPHPKPEEALLSIDQVCMSGMLTRTNSPLAHADLKRANLRGANLHNANLHMIGLESADLRGADLFGADLHRARLEHADLRECILSRAILCYASLHQADLRDAQLGEADLSAADLSLANLEGAHFQNTRFDAHTTLPDYSHWSSDVDMTRFTDPTHRQFWSAGDSPKTVGQKDKEARSLSHWS